jgi:hypothetical protein
MGRHDGNTGLRRHKALILAENVLYSLKMSEKPRIQAAPRGERIFSGRFPRNRQQEA